MDNDAVGDIQSQAYEQGYKDGQEEEKDRLLLIILIYAGVLRQQGRNPQADLVLRVHKFLEDEVVKQMTIELDQHLLDTAADDEMAILTGDTYDNSEDELE